MVGLALSESHGLELFSHALVPFSACLLESVQRLLEMPDCSYHGATVFLPHLFALFWLSAHAMWLLLLNAKDSSQEAHHMHQCIKSNLAIMLIRCIKF